jgi:transposase-like protein
LSSFDRINFIKRGIIMSKAPKKWPPEFKLKLALEALKGERAITQIASEHGINPKQIHRWRDLLLAEGESIFIHKSIQKSEDPDRQKLLHIIDQLTLELEYIKKKLRGNP